MTKNRRLTLLFAAAILIAFAITMIALLPKEKQVGIFYYTWYGALPDDWQPPKFVDSSVFGNYGSQNSTVIRQQLKLIRDAGIDFVVVSWWGYTSPDDYWRFIDNATAEVFRTAKQMADEGQLGNLKIAVMVENFNTSGAPYDYPKIYSYIRDNYAEKYPKIYQNENGKPALYFFYDPNATINLVLGLKGHADSSFINIFVGEKQNWTYTNLNGDFVPQSKEISVAPRFDDSRLPERTNHTTIDPNLDRGFYTQQWQKAIDLWKTGKITTIMITSWNEYPERTAIEPHKDATATNKDPYYLYNQTKNFINQLKR